MKGNGKKNYNYKNQKSKFKNDKFRKKKNFNRNIKKNKYLTVKKNIERNKESEEFLKRQQLGKKNSNSLKSFIPILNF
jgi:hypothetical protein